MKTTTIVSSVSAKTKEAIEIYVNLSEKFKNAYFWTPPSGAYSRRAYEKANSFTYEGDGVLIKFNVSCSCRNIYVSRTVCINGKNTNAKGLKKFLV